MLTPFMTTVPLPAQVLALCSVAEMKENLRISYAKEDALIERCIYAAYDWLAGENGWLNRSVLTTGWTVTLPAFASSIELPKPPAVTVGTFTYLVDGVATTVPADLYKFTIRGMYGFGRINKLYGASWPLDGDTDPDSLVVTYTAGMADGTGAGVKAKYPALHKAMALLAGDYFRNREDTVFDAKGEIDRRILNGVNRVAGRYRFMNNHGA